MTRTCAAALAAALAVATAAAAGNWTIVSPNVATIVTGIACTSEKVCYVPVSAAACCAPYTMQPECPTHSPSGHLFPAP